MLFLPTLRYDIDYLLSYSFIAPILIEALQIYRNIFPSEFYFKNIPSLSCLNIIPRP